MAASGAVPIVEAIFAGASASTLGTSIVGGLLSGWGMAKADEAAARREEEARIREEKRRQATYEGSAEALNWWSPEDVESANDTKTGTEYRRARAGKGMGVARDGLQPQPGEQFRTREVTPKPRYKFDKQGMGIVRQ